MPESEPTTDPTTVAARPRPRLSPRRLYRTVAIAEAVTWTLLIAGMILKYVLDAGDVGVRVGGFLHGFVFLAYGMTAVLVGLNQRWRVRLIAGALLTAVVPYATVPFDRWLGRRNLLDGAWRTAASDDPRDGTVVDRMLRGVLRHPLLLAAGLAVSLVAIFATLLALGPPGR